MKDKKIKKKKKKTFQIKWNVFYVNYKIIYKI